MARLDSGPCPPAGHTTLGPLRGANVLDFPDRALGEHARGPRGVYGIGNDEGRVSVGDIADTAEFAVEPIRHWRNQMGNARFPVNDNPRFFVWHKTADQLLDGLKKYLRSLRRTSPVCGCPPSVVARYA